MYKIGDKFVIEIEEIYTCKEPKPIGFNKVLYRMKGFNSLLFDGYGMSLLKPIEPIEITEAQKQAIYNKGWNDAIATMQKMISDSSKLIERNFCMEIPPCKDDLPFEDEDDGLPWH